MFEMLSGVLSTLTGNSSRKKLLNDARRARAKAKDSHEEVNRILKDAELIEKAKQANIEENKKG